MRNPDDELYSTVIETKLDINGVDDFIDTIIGLKYKYYTKYGHNPKGMTVPSSLYIILKEYTSQYTPISNYSRFATDELRLAFQDLDIYPATGTLIQIIPNDRDVYTIAHEEHQC